MKQVWVVIALCLTGGVLAAQGRHWGIGLYGSGGWVKFSFSDFPTHYFNNGVYQLGMTSQYTTNGRIGWRFGLGFVHASGGYKGMEGGIDIPGFPRIEGDPYEVQFRHSQVSIPMEMLINLNKKPGGFYLLFGPSIRIRLYQEAKKTMVLQGSGEIFTNDFSHNTTNPKVDLFGSFGIGYAFPVSPRYKLYVQPTFTTNVCSEILNTLQDRKQTTRFVTVYEAGVQIGVIRAL